jgi:hypothetical protein
MKHCLVAGEDRIRDHLASAAVFQLLMRKAYDVLAVRKD